VIETAWNSLQEAINVACKESIGHARRVNRYWFDKNDAILTRLIDEKRAALNAFRADPNCNRKKIAYRKAKAEVQSHTRRAKNTWMQDRAREIQEYADTNNMETFFAAVKKIYGPPKSGSVPLLSKDSNILLKAVNSINARWREQLHLHHLPAKVYQYHQTVP